MSNWTRQTSIWQRQGFITSKSLLHVWTTALLYPCSWEDSGGRGRGTSGVWLRDRPLPSRPLSVLAQPQGSRRPWCRGRASVTDIGGSLVSRAVPQSWQAPQTGRAGWCQAPCIPWRRSPNRAGGSRPWWRLMCSAGRGSSSQWFWWCLKGWPWNSPCSVRTHWSLRFGRSPGLWGEGEEAGQRRGVSGGASTVSRSSFSLLAVPADMKHSAHWHSHSVWTPTSQPFPCGVLCWLLPGESWLDSPGLLRRGQSSTV